MQPRDDRGCLKRFFFSKKEKKRPSTVAVNTSRVMFAGKEYSRFSVESPHYNEI